MDYAVLATDGDGTLVRGGRMSRKTVAALKRWKKAGHQLVLVTGETSGQLADFPHLELFDRVVAENGAIIVDSDGKVKRNLGHRPPKRLVRALARAGVEPLREGRSILQAELSQEEAISQVLLQLNTDWKLVRNRHELMILPSGVDKASGLAAVLKELRVSPTRVVGIGDAENDAPLLRVCGLGVAVNNAVPKIKKQSKFVTCGQYGKGIAELIDRLLSGKPKKQKRRGVNGRGVH
jgi:hydroxymethylpyrimidine pyrophosphatase-like HAD family hydrolase